MPNSRYVLFAAALLSCLPAAAQYGQVDGYVLGPNNKGILGAVVGFDRLDAKAHYEAKTDKSGYYQIPNMPTGDYSMVVTVDGQIRDHRDFFHISPGRQDATVGNSALGLTFHLKPPEVVAKEMAKENGTGTDEKATKAREAAEESRKALMDAFAAGQEALEAKKYDEAVVSLTKASEVDSKQAAVWAALADAYVGQASKLKSADAGPVLQKAYDTFAKAIELAPGNAGNYNNFALALAATNKMDDARQNLQKAIELDPAGAGKYHYNLGTFLMNAGQSDAALDELRKGIAADPKYAESYFYLGSILAGKSTTDPSGKMIPPDGTIDALQKYLELKPDGPNAPAAKDLIAALGSKINVDIKDSKARKK